MSQVTIRATGLGKRFRIGRAHAAHGMHAMLDRALAAALGRRRSGAGGADGQHDGHIWALKDCSLEVERGEVVALVGSNGAGKSVLLKLLARVTAPTEGYAEVSGHVAPLLEVGAGFHPELTGRENVYFNGAILGMPRTEIIRKFDEIVAFAGFEPFIDTPTKLYSSGMRMRLAFSVAAHLEPEILLIDEALSVGDAAFRAKCRQKITEFIAHGCTLLLVSHDPTIIAELCHRAIHLRHGYIVQDGSVADVLGTYGREQG